MIGRPITEVETPALLVELDVMEANIAKMASFFKEAGVKWRPHTKGIKVPTIAHKLLKAGAVGITCAKVSEAEVMAASGIRDILIANQVVGPHKTTRVAALCRHADPIATVDSYGDMTVFLHDQLYAVRRGIVEAVWPILGRGKIQ